jgi:hypothetical protein
MRIRENRPTIEDSISTTLEIEGREQMVRHIFDTLGKKGVVVTDEMVHVSHYGFDDRIDWDEHIIVVDRFGVFGFTDAPCPDMGAKADLISRDRAEETSRRLGSEVESAYGLNK